MAYIVRRICGPVDPWFEIEKKCGDDNIDMQNEEGVAFAFSEWAAKRADRKDIGTIDRIFRKVRDAISAIRAAFWAQGYNSAEEIFRRIESG